MSAMLRPTCLAACGEASSSGSSWAQGPRVRAPRGGLARAAGTRRAPAPRAAQAGGDGERPSGSLVGALRDPLSPRWFETPNKNVREASDLAVVNARLDGHDYARVRKNADWLISHMTNWERLYATGELEDEAKIALAYLEEANAKVQDGLSEEASEGRSASDLRHQLRSLQADLSATQSKLQLTQARVGHAVARLQQAQEEAEALGLGEDRAAAEAVASAAQAAFAAAEAKAAAEAAVTAAATSAPSSPPAGYAREVTKRFRRRKLAEASSLRTSARDSKLRDFWYPIAFVSTATKSAARGEATRFDLFSEEWTMAPDAAAPGGWAARNAGAVGPADMPVVAHDGFLWVYPGAGTPPAAMPTQFAQPSGYTLHAEITIDDVPVEHGLLLENLLDLAHAPFTHTTTFARGWSVPDLVKFVSSRMRKPGDGWNDMPAFLAGHPGARGRWQPYPIDMSFEGPCMVLSHIGMVQPGKLVSGDNISASDCEKHLHQLHCCVPGKEGHTRLLYRMCLDFAPWAKHVPLIYALWREMANQVLGEDLRLVEGQQAALNRGSSVWNVPVAYDKLGLNYRRWRNLVDVPPAAARAPPTALAGPRAAEPAAARPAAAARA